MRFRYVHRHWGQGRFYQHLRTDHLGRAYHLSSFSFFLTLVLELQIHPRLGTHIPYFLRSFVPSFFRSPLRTSSPWSLLYIIFILLRLDNTRELYQFLLKTYPCTVDRTSSSPGSSANIGLTHTSEPVPTRDRKTHKKLAGKHILAFPSTLGGEVKEPHVPLGVLWSMMREKD